MPTARQQAEQRATDLLGEIGISRAPVDVEKIARHVGVRLVYERFEGNISGTLIREPDGTAVIGVNTFHTQTRQRFTIAHELGHYLLHVSAQPKRKADVFIDKPAEVLFRDGMSALAVDPKEIGANSFAAALLMPADLIRDAVTRLFKREPDSGADLITADLAREFGVSEQAMGYRLTNLSLIDPI